MATKFRDRTEAGQQLAVQLQDYANRPDALVLALPRGGVPVGYEIAQALNLPLDIYLVRKLGAPGQEELAMGAIASGGIMVLNHDLLRSLNISRQTLMQVAKLEKQELDRRMQAYRGDRPEPQIRDRLIILVDDGIATSATLRAAITGIQRQQPQGIVVAAPIAPASVCEALRTIVQSVVCLSMPEPLHSIGMWYENFSQTTDEEVRWFLQQASIDQMENLRG